MARSDAVNHDFTDYTLASGVSIGGSSATVNATPGWPSSGTFAVLVGDTTSPSTCELIHVTRSAATLTLASPSTTFTKNHSAGVPLVYLGAAEDWNNKFSLDKASNQTIQGYIDAANSGASGLMLDGGATAQLDAALGLFFPNGVQIASYGLTIGDPTAGMSVGSPAYFTNFTSLLSLGMDNALDTTVGMSSNKVIDPTLGSIYKPSPTGGGLSVYLNNDTLMCPWMIFIRNAVGASNIQVNVDPLSSGAMESGAITLAANTSVVLFYLGGIFYRIL